MALRVGAELGLDAARAEAARARRALPRHRQDRDPGGDPRQAGPARRATSARSIEQHPELGERILAPIEQLEEVRAIVRACHERFDGTRLPRPARGRGDPARGADHLRLRRVPRDDDRPSVPAALPVDEARRRLAEAAGTQFDPARRGRVPPRARAPMTGRAARAQPAASARCAGRGTPRPEKRRRAAIAIARRRRARRRVAGDEAAPGLQQVASRVHRSRPPRSSRRAGRAARRRARRRGRGRPASASTARPASCGSASRSRPTR